MRHTGLGKIDPEAVLDVLYKNEFLTRIDIRDNNLPSTTVQKITMAMDISHSLLVIRM